ncbi:activating signal cointegrator 1 [Ischnura elegans]|uniref:activating signal cointegrator 1 n=1 Tax=Ischnura elegans TaxID=197161 RepID=UPI001ED8B920|nr:activating signal cointegrator 1 [Ischnura elegans]
MSESVSEWLEEELSKLLSFPVPSDLISYILSIENARDLEDYLKTLLNFQEPTHRQLLTDLLRKSARQNQAGKGNKTSEVEEKYTVSKQNEKKNKSLPPPEQNSKKEQQVTGATKKKSKYVGLYTQEGQNKDVVLLKGRHKCLCQASKHGLINNCIQCGRIICEQEGPGPCLFCGNLVYPPGEGMEMPGIASETQIQYMKQMATKSPEWEEAMARRDRLLEYDRTCEKRTKVIDDEMDYFSSSSPWLSKEEREELRKRELELKEKRDSSRKNKTISFDFAGRRVIEEESFNDVYDPDDPVLKAISESVLHKGKSIPEDNSNHPNMFFPQPIFQDSSDASSNNRDSNSNPGMPVIQRVQDQGLLEMHDQGLCLSLHQPWASLLVYGIMKDEGRTWYTSHRGRLWIAAASKVPLPQDVKETEDFFRRFENNESIKFPSQYPTSCLLGFVDVVDCLSQEDYRIKYPEGRSESPYVLVCENPHHLPIYFPLQGKHKIYKLDPKIHQAAQKALHRIAKLQAEKLMEAMGIM